MDKKDRGPEILHMPKVRAIFLGKRRRMCLRTGTRQLIANELYNCWKQIMDNIIKLGLSSIGI